MNSVLTSPLLRRLALMVGGEAIQSGFHFALNIALLHVLSASGYGIFAIGMVMGGVGLAYIRSLTAVPASIWMSKSRTRNEIAAYDVTFGTAALLLALGMGLVSVILMHMLGDPSGIAAGCFVAAWSLRSHMRTASFARGEQIIVCLSDFAFIVAGTALSALVLWMGSNVQQGVFFALATANLFGVVALVRLAGRPIRLSLRPSVRRRYTRMWPQLRWSGFSATTATVQGQCLALLVAGIAGPAAYAPIAAALVLFGPLRITSLALSNMTQPELSKLVASNQPRRVWTQAKLWALVMGLGGVAYGTGILFVLPMIRSETLQQASVGFIGLLAMANYVPIMLYVMPRIILEIVGDFRAVALITTTAAIVGFVLIAILLAIAPPAWSLAGAAVSEIFVLIASWMFARRHIKALKRKLDQRAGSSPSWRLAGQPVLATEKR